MVQLLAAHGQGGSGYADKDWPYHNSFLIADPVEAFVWETSGRHWAAKRVSTVASVSNHLTIGADWDELSPDTVAFAVEQGWWPRDSTDRFDFARAYRDTTVAPEVISSGRYGRTCALLERAQGSVDAAQLRGWLRDHYGRVDPRAGVTPADPEYFSICMHADPVGTTTASVVAELRSEPKQTLYWACLGSPCVSVFFPIFLDVALPPVLTEGSESDSDRSAWWQFHRLLERVEQSWEERLPLVRRAFDALEAAFAERVPELLNASREDRQSFVDAATVEILEVASDLIRRFR
jgi:dipeptidase